MIWKKITLVILISIFALGILTQGIFSRSYYIEEGKEQVYESKLFNGQTIEIEIEMPQSKAEIVLCNAIINGQEFSNVGVSSQQNQITLSFAKGESCWGLDYLVLNKTNFDLQDMKQLFMYDMFGFLEMPASKTALANVSVNGVSQGTYIAIEGVRNSFLRRNFGTDKGQLYVIQNNSQFSNTLRGTQAEDYQILWENAVTQTTQKDKKRLVQTLQQVNQGNLQAVEISMLCKYMAVQTFASEVPQEYYLYEQDGKLSILPVDKIQKTSENLQISIDKPIVPQNIIFSVILNNQQTRALYYDYLYALSTDYLQNGTFTRTTTHLKKTIGCSPDIETLETATYQRAQNVLTQLQLEK